MTIEVVSGSTYFISGLVSAKWAMELGFSQFRQLLWAVLGPLGMLILYLRMLGQRRNRN